MRRFRLYGMTLLVALLVVVYTMTSAGRFHIVDEVSLFAVTESLALRGQVDTNAIAWTQWVNSPGEVLGAFGPDGEVYSKKGPGPAFLAVPWYLALRLSGLLGFTVGLLQSTLLWNGIVTAVTAALLWLTAVRLGYRDRAGLVLGLLFGLATIAWPYANHFFGEPLSAFSLLLAFYGILSWLRSGRTSWMILAGLGAGCALITVTAHAVLVAVLGAYASIGWWLPRQRARNAAASVAAGTTPHEERTIGRYIGGLAAFGLPLVAAGGLLLWYNTMRFGSPLDTGYHFDSGEGFTTPFFQGFWGLVGSPYRGLFWHTPLFIASLAGAWPFFKRDRLEAVVIAGLSAALIGLYSLWWMWWGGFAWGPRFLVPMTPFWVLLTAPLVERLLAPVDRADPEAGAANRLWQQVRSWGAGGGVLVLTAVLSFFVQISAVVVNYVNYEIELRALYPTNWDDPLEFGPPAQSIVDLADSPVFGQWKLIRNSLTLNSDLAWFSPSGDIDWLVVLVGGLAWLTLVIALGIWWQWASQGKMIVPGVLSWLVLAGLPVLLIAVWSGEATRSLHYGRPDAGYRAALRDLCTVADEQDALVTVAPFTYQVPMNWLPVYCRTSLPVYGYAANSLEHAETQEVMARLQRENDRLWMITGGLPVNDPENTLERWLAERAFKADDQWYEDYRLVRYATTKLVVDAPEAVLNIPLTEVDDGGAPAGHQVTILAMRTPDVVDAGGILPVEIDYRLDTPPTADLRWFVQLIAPDGFVSALLDTGPSDGYERFTALPPGEELLERAGLQIPANAETGTYQLIAGLYDPNAQGTPRLRSPDGSDFVELGKVDVIGHDE